MGGVSWRAHRSCCSTSACPHTHPVHLVQLLGQRALPLYDIRFFALGAQGLRAHAQALLRGGGLHHALRGVKELLERRHLVQQRRHVQQVLTHRPQRLRELRQRKVRRELRAHKLGVASLHGLEQLKCPVRRCERAQAGVQAHAQERCRVSMPLPRGAHRAGASD